MKLLLQRVTEAAVWVDGRSIASIERGLLVLAGFGRYDTVQQLPQAVEKLIHLRLFADDRGRFQFSLLQCGYSVLAVPQFTLYANAGSGRRPDFAAAMPPDDARRLFDEFCALLQKRAAYTAFGRFGADMQVKLVNDGPVTLMIEI